MISEQTITKFFKGECSAADAAAVEAYLHLHPHVLEKYMGLTEWEHFDQPYALNAAISEGAWSRVATESLPASRQIPVLWKRIAVAASIVLVIGVGMIWYFAGLNTSSSNGNEKLAVSAMNNVKNATSNKMTVQLSDSSVVELMPGSELSYPEGFTSDERKVILHGEALFAVARQPHRPFRVITDSLITEVLGTRFTIRSNANEDHILVSLHEGKVRVSSSGLLFAGDMQSYQLMPGDKLRFDKYTRRIQIDRPPVSTLSQRSAVSTSSLIKTKGVAGNNWYMFHNQSIPEVLQQLSRIYHTPIYYDKKELQGLSFIGKIDKTDSLENVLRSIALLNELQLHKQEDGYRLKK